MFFFPASYIGRIAGEHDIVGIVMPRCGSVYDIFIHVGWMDGWMDGWMSS